MQVRTIALSATLLLPLSLAAQTYNYTGDDFDIDVSGAYTNTDFVSVSLTFSAPLPDSFGGYVYPTSWSFSDGFQSNNSTDPINPGFGDEAFFIVVTNSSGQITNWDVQDSFSGPTGGRIIGSYYAADDSISYNRGYDDGSGGGYGEYDGSPSTPPDFNPPGSWSGPVSEVPEGGSPFAFLLLSGACLCGAALFRFRKRLKSLTA